ncbi:TraX family protein, partial [Stenotrophomonas sp. GbtcB23]|uniref:TraX family protein n=1 Tax=Stenotrophomonas sp. GbtcB23 TaxID=2824768 RepID=UPI0020C69710
VFVLGAWHWFRSRRDLLQAGASINGLYYETLRDWRDYPFVMVLPLCLLCAYNGNGWALLAPPVLLLGDLSWKVPRTRWAFYGYYVGHLALFCAVARMDG